MNKWKRATIILIIIIMFSVSGCTNVHFKKVIFNTEYIPEKIPDVVPDWWKSNLKQYLDLSYITNGNEAAFGALSSDVFTPDLYSTYASVGILKTLSQNISEPEKIIKWVRTLKISNCIYSDKKTSFDPIKSYWVISILKELNGPLPNKNHILQLFKKYERNDGTFMFENSDPASLNSRISQTYFVISIMKMLNIKPDTADKVLNLQSLSKTLQQYISKHINNTSLSDTNRSGYLISAIYELTYIDKDLITSEVYAWLTQGVRQIDSLPYGVIYIALINNLSETIKALNLDIGINEISKYLKEKVIPEQNLSGGFSLQKEYSNLLEPMFTYEIVKLFKVSGIRYPNLDRMLKTLDIHRIDNGWIKFITFNPSIQATYFAVQLAKESGSLKDYSRSAIINYLNVQLDSIESELHKNDSVEVKSLYKPDVIVGKLKTLYYISKTYISIVIPFSNRKKREIINVETALLNELPENLDDQDTLLYNTKGFSYFILTSNALGYFPKDSLLLNKIENISYHITNLMEHNDEFKNIRILYNLFVLNNVIDFYEPQRGDTNAQIIDRVLLALSTQNGFKRYMDINTADINSTYLGLQIKNGDLTDIDKGKVIKFVMDSIATYGFNYTPEDNNSDLRSTYDALWIISYLKTGYKFNYSHGG